ILGDLLAIGRVDVVDDDGGALLGQSPRDGLADALARAGDDRDLAFQTHGLPPLGARHCSGVPARSAGLRLQYSAEAAAMGRPFGPVRHSSGALPANFTRAGWRRSSGPRSRAAR